MMSSCGKKKCRGLRGQLRVVATAEIELLLADKRYKQSAQLSTLVVGGGYGLY